MNDLVCFEVILVVLMATGVSLVYGFLENESYASRERLSITY